MTEIEKSVLAYFYRNSDLSISVADLVQDLRASRQDIVKSLKQLQAADLIEMVTGEYGRITPKGIEEAPRLL